MNTRLIVSTVLAPAGALLLLAAGSARQQAPALPASGDSAVAALNASPRHGEWVKYDGGSGDSVRAWVVHPERRDRAPVVVVIHENSGLSDWARAVADRLAADGFIAIAPDLLSGKGPNGGGTESVDRQGALALNRALDRGEVQRRLAAAARYGTSLPSATNRFGVVGFCWGGGQSFNFAVTSPELGASVVYYGPSPADSLLEQVRAPVLGLYGGDDARINAMVPPAQAKMQQLGKRYEVHTYEGAGHGFLRDQAGREGANRRAAEQAWPRTIAFFREHLGR